MYKEDKDEREKRRGFHAEESMYVETNSFFGKVNCVARDFLPAMKESLIFSESTPTSSNFRIMWDHIRGVSV